MLLSSFTFARENKLISFERLDSFRIKNSISKSNYQKILINHEISDEWAQALIQTDNNEFLLVGRTSNNEKNGDIILIKTDSNGNKKWGHIYSGENDDWARAVIQTTDGGFLIAGYTYSLDNFFYGFDKMFLIKTDGFGALEWKRTYGGINPVAAFALVKTFEGGFAITGCKFNTLSDSTIWLVKFDPDGIMEWEKVYDNSPFLEVGNALIQTSDGGFLVIGSSYNIETKKTNIMILKTDEIGTMQWNQTFNKTVDQFDSSLVQTADGGFVLTDTFFYGETDKHDMWLIKINNTGNLQWSHAYGGDGDKWVYTLINTSDEGFVLAGGTDILSDNHGDVWIAKTDKNGTLQWLKTYGGKNHETAKSIVQTADEGFLLAGTRDDTGEGSFDIWLVKIDSFGTIQWTQIYYRNEMKTEISISLLDLFVGINYIGVVILTVIFVIMSIFHHKR